MSSLKLKPKSQGLQARAGVEEETDSHEAYLAFNGAEEPRHSRRIASTREVRCPHCRSIVYSRKNELCGVCCKPLPAELLFHPLEVARIEDLLHMERRRHSHWMRREY